MNPALFDAGLVALIASCLLLVALWAFDRFAPSGMMRERHDLTLAALLVVPLVFALALQPRPAVQEVDFLPTGVNEAITVADAAPGPKPEAGSTPNPLTRTVGDLIPVQLPWASLSFVAWMTGSALMLLRLCLDLGALSLLRHRSKRTALPGGLYLSRPVEIRRSDRVPSPLMAGYLRPAIYLPADFKLDGSARPILEHEIAHLTRGDAWTVLGLRFITAVFCWVVPLYALQRMLSRSREALCDEVAARVTGEPIQLAHALLDTAQRQLAHPSLALAAGSSRTALASRVHHLSSIDLKTQRTPVMRIALILPAVAAVAFIATPKVGAAVGSERWEVSYDVEDVSPLFHAAARGRISEVRAMLEAGADPNEVSIGDGAPLFAAIRAGRRDVFDLLMQYGADPNLPVSGDGSPMIAAARNGQLEMLQLMLSSGASLDAGVEGDGNPLIAAVQAGDRNMVEFLLEAGAEVDAYVWGDETPMVAAAQKGDVRMAELLAEAGADLSLTVRSPNRHGQEEYRSPLSEARRMGHGDMEGWLMRRGAQHQPPAE